MVANKKGRRFWVSEPRTIRRVTERGNEWGATSEASLVDNDDDNGHNIMFVVVKGKWRRRGVKMGL